MASHCENFRAFLYAPDTGNGDGLLARARCKKWSCAYCAGQNRKQWRYRIGYAAEALEIECWSFITITAHSEQRGLASLKNLRVHWDVLLKRMRREYGKFPYIRVFEKHEDGSYHVHALLGFHFPATDLKTRKSKNGNETSYSTLIDDYVRRKPKPRQKTVKVGKRVLAALPRGATHGLGWYHHAENLIHAYGAAKYVTKYMTKGDDKMENGLRRIQASQGFPKPPRDAAQYEWRVYSGFSEEDAWQHWSVGADVVDVSRKRVLTPDDFENGTLWPPED